jgi:hypothetical protein
MASSAPQLPSDLSTLDDKTLSDLIGQFSDTLGILKSEQTRRLGGSNTDEIDASDPVALKKFLVNLRDEVKIIKASVVSNPKPPVPVEFVSYVASEKQKPDEKDSKWNSHPEVPDWTYPQPNLKDPWLYYI